MYKGVNYDISVGQHQPSPGLLSKTRIYMVFIFSCLQIPTTQPLPPV